jgi:hypothetical protein
LTVIDREGTYDSAAGRASPTSLHDALASLVAGDGAPEPEPPTTRHTATIGGVL